MTVEDPSLPRQILAANGLSEDVNLDTLTHLELVMDKPIDLAAFSRFKSLKSLYLVNQKIESLTPLDSFGGLPFLERLFLNENRLTTLNGISSCPNLVELQAPFNQLSSLSNFELPRLTLLDVAHNDLFDFNGISQSVLNLAKNKISDDAVSAGLSKLPPNLRSLNLAGNPIHAIPSVARLLAFSASIVQLDLQDVDYGVCPVCRQSTYLSFALSLVSPSMQVLDGRPVKDEDRDEAAKLFVVKDRFYVAKEVAVDIATLQAEATLQATTSTTHTSTFSWLRRSRDSLISMIRREFKTAGTFSFSPRMTPVSSVQQLLLDAMDASVQIMRFLSHGKLGIVKVVIRNIYKMNISTSVGRLRSSHVALFAVNKIPDLMTNNILLADPTWLAAVVNDLQSTSPPAQGSVKVVGGEAWVLRVEEPHASVENGTFDIQDFLFNDGRVPALAPGNIRRLRQDERVFVMKGKATERWKLDFDLILSREDRPGERVAWRLDSDEAAWTARYIEEGASAPSTACAEAHLNNARNFSCPRFSSRGIFQSSLHRLSGIAWSEEDCQVAEGEEEQAESVEIVGGMMGTLAFERFRNLKILALANCEINSIEHLSLPLTLEQLSVAGNKLHVISGLQKLSRLMRLDAGSNLITEIRSLPKGLRTLRVENNKLNDSCIEGLSEAVSLQDLYLALNRIEEKRTLLRLKGLPGLEILDMSGNPCAQEESYKDYVIFHLRSLRMLDGRSVLVADHRGATERIGGFVTLELLEERLGRYLSHVVSLDLKSSQLRSLGSVINQFHFPALMELLLDDNQLFSVKGIGSLPHLARLSLNENRFKSLHPDVAGCLDECTKLAVLQLNSNKITTLTDVALFCDVSRLRILSCTGNALVSIEGLQNCKKLKELNVERNSLRVLDQLSLTGIANSLNYLHLSENALKSINGVQVLRKLKHLSLSANRIADISEVETLATLQSSLRLLCLTQNPLSRRHMYRLSVIRALPFLRSLDDVEVTTDETARVEQISGTMQAAPLMTVLPALPGRRL